MTGVQQYALKLSMYLKDQLGAEACFVSPHGILHQQLAAQLGVQVIGNTKGYFWEQVELPFWLKKEGSPLLINFGNVAPQYYSNQVVTIHDLSTMEHPEWFSHKFARIYRMMIPQVAQNARKVIAVSHFTKRKVHELLKVDLEKIEVIYNSLETINPPNLNQVPEPYFTSVGSFSGRKNFTTLIKAFIEANIPGFTLKIRGDSENIFKEEAELPELTRHQHHIQFVEPLNYEAYLDLVKNATALINTSVYEGFGMPNLEALSMGVPVICSDIEVFREVMGDCATYAPPFDHFRLAQILTEAAHQPITLARKKLLTDRAEMFKTETEGKKLLDLVAQCLSPL